MALCMAVPTIALAAGRTGIGAVGLDAFAEEDVLQLAEILVAAEGDVEVAALAYSFRPGEAFSNFTLLVQETLPRIQARLTITTYLDDGPNRRDSRYRATHVLFRPKLAPRAFWATVLGENGARARKTFFTDWHAEVVDPYALWAWEITEWARLNDLRTKLNLIVVPVLEDDAPTADAYQALLWPTIRRLDGLGIRYRRNPDGAYDSKQRVVSPASDPLPYELHTTQSPSDLAHDLRRNDVINNDGCFVLYPGEGDRNPNCPSISILRFRENQRSFTADGVHSLLWRKEFNGGPRPIPPRQRGELRPFAAPRSAESLLQTLRSRSGP